jgi:hypothetical protein
MESFGEENGGSSGNPDITISRTHPMYVFVMVSEQFKDIP